MRIAIAIVTLALAASACAETPDGAADEDEITTTEQPLRKLCVQLMDQFNRALDDKDASALVSINARSREAGCGELL